MNLFQSIDEILGEGSSYSICLLTEEENLANNFISYLLEASGLELGKVIHFKGARFTVGSVDDKNVTIKGTFKASAFKKKDKTTKETSKKEEPISTKDDADLSDSEKDYLFHTWDAFISPNYKYYSPEHYKLSSVEAEKIHDMLRDNIKKHNPDKLDDFNKFLSRVSTSSKDVKKK